MSIKSLLMAISTYSAVPVPQFEWKEENWKYAICWFPCVGIITGGITFFWIWIARISSMSMFLFASVAVCIPLLVTGGIHMDGYMDTVDALSSHQSVDKKLEILKDPNAGAFAVIYCGIYLLLSLGLFYQLGPVKTAYIICPGYVYSRTLSAFCAVTIKNARGSGMLSSFTEGLDKKKALTGIIVFCALSAAAMALAGGLEALIPIIAGLMVMLWYRSFTMRKFGGCTGDTAGFFLQICELAILASLTIGEFII